MRVFAHAKDISFIFGMPLVHACLSVSEWSFVIAKEVTSMFSLCPIMIYAYAIHGATVICKFFMQETYLGLGETARKYANAIWHQIYIKHSFLSIKNRVIETSAASTC